MKNELDASRIAVMGGSCQFCLFHRGSESPVLTFLTDGGYMTLVGLLPHFTPRTDIVRPV
jgi:hypothetical protein